MRKIAVLLLVAAAAGCAREKSGISAPPPAHTSAPPAVAAGTGTEVGNLMPPYSGNYLDGKPLELASQKGTVVFLNVWATWCGPCRFEIPELEALHQKYSSRGFKVIGISVDESGAAAVARFVKDNKMTYPIGLDASAKIADLLHTSVLPTSLIIGRDGRILWRSYGAMTPNDVTAADAIIERALQAKS